MAKRPVLNKWNLVPNGGIEPNKAYPSVFLSVRESLKELSFEVAAAYNKVLDVEASMPKATVAAVSRVGSAAAAGGGGGGGSVTSVGLTMPAVFAVAGSPITTTGTLAVTASGTSGGVPYFNAATTMASSAALAVNAIVFGGGAGAAPATPLGLGTTTTVLHGNAAGAPTWAAVSLTADVSGTLPVANGGTGQTSASTAFNALSPLTTLGDVLYGAASGAGTRLAGNTTTTRQFLRQTGDGAASAAPAWDTVTKADVLLSVVENTALSTWAGSAAITTLGTITTGTWNGTDVAVTAGGTGASDASTARTNLGLAIGTDVQAYSANLGAIAALAVTDSNIIVGNGVAWVAESGATARTSLGLTIGTDVPGPTGTGASGTWGISVSGNAATVTAGVYTTGSYADPTWITSLAGSKISGNISGSAANVTGVVALVNGGTGTAAASANAAFNALSPLTTLGDVLYGAASGAGTRLAGNTTTTRNFLRQTGDGVNSAAPAWDTVTKTDVGLGSVENTALSTWAGTTNITTLGTITSGTWNGTDVAVTAGGTGASDASTARTNLGLAIGTDVPGPTGTGASGTWGISVSGNAATATALATARAINGTNFDGTAAITVPVNNADDTATAATMYPLWTATAGGNYAAKVSTTKLSFVPSTGILTATGFAGALTGNVTGNVTGTAANVTGIVALVNGGTGQTSASTAFNALSPLTTLGDVLYGAASGAGTRLAGNTTTTRNFLRQTGDGVNSAAPAWDTVTKADVGLSAVENTALSTWAGTSNITTLGTITSGVWNGTDVAVTAGGTGASDASTARTNLGLAIGTDVQAYSATLAAVAGGTYSGDDSIVTVGTIGAGVWQGTAIGVGYGGTGLASYTVGDLLYASGVTALSKLAAGTAGYVLTSGGAGIAPSWAAASVGTVTSVALAMPAIFSVSGSPVTGTGTLTAALANQDANLVWAGPAAAPAAAPTFRSLVLADMPDSGTQYQMLQSGGVSAAPAYSTATWPATTTVNQLLYSSSANVVAGLSTANSSLLVTSGAGAPSWATDIPTAVTIGMSYIYRAGGTDVPVADGGTGASTASAGFNALSPLTTLGDVLYGAASGAGTRLAGNTTTTRQFLRQTGDGANSAAPAWDTVTKADVGLGSVENTALSTWAGTTNITTLGTITTGTWNAGAVTSSSTIFATTTLGVVSQAESGVLAQFGSVASATSGNHVLRVGSINAATVGNRGAGLQVYLEQVAAGAAAIDQISFGFRNDAGNGEGPESRVKAIKGAGGNTSSIELWYGTSAGGNAAAGLIIAGNGAATFASTLTAGAITSSGAGQFTAGANAAAITTLQGYIDISPAGNNNYNEGIRIHPSTGGDSVIVLGAVAGGTGTGAGQWSLIRYNDANSNRFAIHHNSTDFVTCSTAGAWDFQGNTISSGAITSTAAITVQPSITDGDSLLSAIQTNSNNYVHSGLKIQAGGPISPWYLYQSGGLSALRLNYGSISDTGGVVTFGTDGAITSSGVLSVDDTTDASSTVTGSIHTDGGLGVAKKAYFGDVIVTAAPTTAIPSIRLPAGTAPTSPTEGDIWNDSAQKSKVAFIDGMKQYGAGVLFAQSANVTVTGTTSFTTILSGIGGLALPANFWVVGKTLRITLAGTFVNDPAGNSGILIRNGASDWVEHVISTNSGAWTLDVVLSCRVASASGSIEKFARGSRWNVGTEIPSVITGTITGQDTTAAMTLTIGALPYSASVTVICTTALVEVLC